MKLVYTTVYERKIDRILTASERKAAEDYIASNPTFHPVIQGTGGIRKARVARAGMGKRGGARIIFYYWQVESTIFMLTAYAKGAQEDLSAEEKKQLKALVDTLKQKEKE
jgi:hypothetical protein